MSRRRGRRRWRKKKSEEKKKKEEDYVYFKSCGGFPGAVQLQLMDGAVNAGNGKRTQSEIKFVFLCLSFLSIFLSCEDAARNVKHLTGDIDLKPPPGAYRAPPEDLTERRSA